MQTVKELIMIGLMKLQVLFGLQMCKKMSPVLTPYIVKASPGPLIRDGTMLLDPNTINADGQMSFLVN